MNVDMFIEKLEATPEAIEFNDTIALIDSLYRFIPVEFKNGEQVNAASENSGSSKIFAFAKKHGLSEQRTLMCFGGYYRDDVLKHPNSNDHQNIRNFMKTGWAGVEFATDPLQTL